MEEKISENYPLPITIEGTEKILEQMKKGICKIKNKNGKGTGFFCKITYENEIIPVMITANHIINQEIIDKEKKINVTLNDDDENQNKNIKIDSNRKIYTNEKYDITIIEIKPDEDEVHYFLEIDKNIFREINNIYNESIYIPQYPKYGNEQKASVSYGILRDIQNYDLFHFCSTEVGSSGSPILNISNNKVIGMHKASIRLNYNKGTFLKDPITEFMKSYTEFFERKNQEPISCIPYLINQKDISYNIFKKDISISIKVIEKNKGNYNFSYDNYESEYNKLKQCIDQDKGHLNCLINEFTEKCRYYSIKPYRHNSIQINTKDKYINASPVNFYYNKYIILTQGPKANTIEDFWTMVDQYKINIIIMLTKLEENSVEKCANYWDSRTKLNKYKLEILSEEHLKFKTIVTRKIKLIDTVSNNERIITQLHYLAWPDLGIPISYLNYKEFIYMIEESEKNKSNLPVIIHCGGGVGRTGTFTAIYFLYKEIMEQINNKNLTNIRFSVFNMVRKLKEIRLYSVETPKQYQFIYEFINWVLINYNI